ncbi:hypothetical protein BVRB_4g077600 [Beta vulgaris subsp. vulgaris]|nr:hypothetical protein BVRB_4g077600 [Beta vulgaris subsp. vulgaris]
MDTSTWDPRFPRSRRFEGHPWHNIEVYDEDMGCKDDVTLKTWSLEIGLPAHGQAGVAQGLSGASSEIATHSQYRPMTFGVVPPPNLKHGSNLAIGVGSSKTEVFNIVKGLALLSL